MIKIVKDIQINPQRAVEFEALFSKVLQDIQQNEANFNIQPITSNDQVNYQFWQFEFCGEGNFEGKMISGVLKFQPDHPAKAPKCYFNQVQTNKGLEVLMHENIYGDNMLCIPQLTYWNSTTTEYELLEAIAHTFHNPNWSASANPCFSCLGENEKKQIQQEQAKYLPEFQMAQ